MQEILGIGVARRLPQLLVGRVPVSVAQIVARRGGEHHRVLRHHRDALADVGGIGVAQVDAVEQDLALLRIVEALGELKDRRLAGARRADHREPLALLHPQAEIVERRDFAPGRVVEGHMLERELAERRLGQRDRPGGRLDIGLGLEQFGQALGCARGAQQVAEDLGQGPERPAQQPAAKHEGGDRPAAHPPGGDVDRALPDHQHDRADQEEDHAGGEDRTHADAALGGREHALDRVGETLGLAALLAERLDDLHRTQDFAGDGADLGDPALVARRNRAHSAPENDDRTEHDRNAEQHRAGEFWREHEHGAIQPTPRTMLRSATDTVVPTTCSMIVVSTVIREVISAGRFSSKNPGDRRSKLR